ncbi:MAG TPA: carbohydrate kinase family protein [Planctomycetes bacterium]|nr:carbohydrate kinase family protein [Planctomycetota bacterium]
MSQIAVTGSVAFDHIMNFPGKFQDHILADKLHILNVSFLVQDLRRLRGGCAANIAYACALLGLKPVLTASVGTDFAPYGDWLAARGVDLGGVHTVEEMLTASCFITTDETNNQITGFYPGAMTRAGEAKIANLPGDKPALAIVSPNDPGAMKAYPAECRELGVPFLYDPGQNIPALSGEELFEGLRGAKAVVCNDYELAMVQEKSGKSLEDLLEVCETVVVTLGEKGSRIHPRGEDAIEVPAVKVEKAVDPTGAGDAYRGGLIKGLMSGEGWESAARLGSLVAAYCVEHQGTSNYSFTREQFNARFEQAYGLVPSV